MMLKFGFNEVWIDTVMRCISSVSYSFLHNGDEFGRVFPQRGLRQGNPISLYIYIMCAKGLSSMIRRSEEVGLLHGCRIARGAPSISHLFFLRMIAIFLKANEGEASVMENILQKYASISGQSIKFQ